jgi:hypothetical protein
MCLIDFEAVLVDAGDGLDDCGLLVGSKVRVGGLARTDSREFISREVVCLGRREAEQVTKFRKIVVILGEKRCTTTTLTTIHTLSTVQITQEAHNH